MKPKKLVVTITFIATVLAGSRFISPKIKSCHFRNSEKIETFSEDEMKPRMIWANMNLEIIVHGSVSPDGQYISLADDRGWFFALLNIESGKIKLIANKEKQYDSCYFKRMSWSRDSKQIAYTCRIDFNVYELRIISLEDFESRTIYCTKEISISPLDWSPDGKFILAYISSETFILISVKDGSTRTLKTLSEDQWIGRAFFSPDGHNIAYEKSGGINPGIFIFSVDSCQELCLWSNQSDLPYLSRPPSAELLGWSPDGEKIYVKKSQDIFAVSVKQVENQRIARLPNGIGEYITSLGITKNGQFYFFRDGDHSFDWYEDFYMLKLNPESGKIVSREKLDLPNEIYPNEICSSLPVWSPDGKFLLYMTITKAWPFKHTLYIQSVMTDEVRKIPFNRPIEFRGWLPDGENIVTYAEEEGFFKINIRSGEIIPFKKEETNKDIYYYHTPPDNRSLFFARINKQNRSKGRLMVKDLETGEEKELFQTTNRKRALSSDGNFLASIKYPRKPYSVISINSIHGGEQKEIFRLSDKNHQIRDIKWSTDDRFLYFSKTWVPANHLEANEVVILGGGGMYSLWLILCRGGKVQDLETDCDDFIIHPDGHHVLYCLFKDELTPLEIWVMDNIFASDWKSQDASDTPLNR